MMSRVFLKKRYPLLIVAFLLIYYLSLRFVFPGYFSPLYPHHSDILDYPYDLLAGFQVLSSRPTGLILTWFFGLFFSWKGVIISAVLSIFLSLILISEIIEHETNRTVSTLSIIIYMILAMCVPTFYLNYSFDIYGTYALVIGLVGVRLTYGEKLKAKPFLRGTLFFIVMLLSFLSKETYIVSFGFFYFVKVVLDRTERRQNVILMVLVGIAGVLSLLYGKVLGSSFVSSSTNEMHPYYVSLKLDSLIHSFLYYAEGIGLVPMLVLLAISVGTVIINHDRSTIIALMFCFSGILAYAPYAVLPNKLVPHYIFVAIPMLMAVILLLRFPDSWKTRGWDRLIKVALCVIVIVSYCQGKYSYQSMNGWIATEKGMKQTIDSLDVVNREIKPNDKVLVLGLENDTENFYRSYFAAEKFLPDQAHFDVNNAYPEFCGELSSKVTYIPYYSKDNLDQYSKIIIYSDGDEQILNRGSEEFLHFQQGDGYNIIIHDTDIYPGTLIHRSDVGESGIAIAITLSQTNSSMKIVVDGEMMSTSYAETFISTMLSPSVLERDSIEVCVFDSSQGIASDTVMILICD